MGTSGLKVFAPVTVGASRTTSTVVTYSHAATVSHASILAQVKMNTGNSLGGFCRALPVERGVLLREPRRT